jgi:hypothetical protein
MRILEPSSREIPGLRQEPAPVTREPTCATAAHRTPSPGAGPEPGDIGTQVPAKKCADARLSSRPRRSQVDSSAETWRIVISRCQRTRRRQVVEGDQKQPQVESWAGESCECGPEGRPLK